LYHISLGISEKGLMMNTRVITVASGKGGTGKTSTVVNLGTALALLGKKTAILDADIAMANIGLHLGIEKSPVTLHDVLSGTASIRDAIYEAPSGLMIVPCGVSLSGFERSDPEKLRTALTEMTHEIEFLLIDAPAGLSKDGLIPLALADDVVLVVNPEISSLADALKTKRVAEMLGSHVSGTILNRVGGERTDLSRQEVSKILGTDVIAVVPDDVEVRRSAALKKPIVLRRTNSPAAIAYRKLAAQMAGTAFTEPRIAPGAGGGGFIGRFVRTVFGG